MVSSCRRRRYTFLGLPGPAGRCNNTTTALASSWEVLQPALTSCSAELSWRCSGPILRSSRRSSMSMLDSVAEKRRHTTHCNSPERDRMLLLQRGLAIQRVAKAAVVGKRRGQTPLPQIGRARRLVEVAANRREAAHRLVIQVVRNFAKDVARHLERRLLQALKGDCALHAWLRRRGAHACSLGSVPGHASGENVKHMLRVHGEE